MNDERQNFPFKNKISKGSLNQLLKTIKADPRNNIADEEILIENFIKNNIEFFIQKNA